MQTIFAFKKKYNSLYYQYQNSTYLFLDSFYKILQINITNIPLQIIKTNFLHIQLHTLLFLIL